ncbi:MAG: preprotein translocase subunit SecD, partial [Gemmatimonadota bacterium]
MSSQIRNRLLIIALLVIASVYNLFPRTITIRERGPDGVMRDTQVTKVPLKLGLDLQGGMHLGLELDQSQVVSADPKKDLDLALTVLRKRIDEFGVTEPVIQKSGDSRIVVELAGITDPARAKGIVQKTAFLEFRITDKTQALERALPSIDRALRGMGITPQSVGASGKGGASAVEQLLGGDSAKQDTSKAATDTLATGAPILGELIQPAAGAGFGPMPGEYMVPEPAFPRVDSLLHLPEVQRLLPRNVVLRWAAAPISIGVQPYRLLYALEDKPIITGASLVDASAQLDPLTNGSIVVFTLDRAGARRFGQETARHVGDYMAILLDDRVQGRPPVIQSRIDRNGQITLGNKPIQEAQDLALTLKAGSLPVPLKIVEERQVGASLGQDSIRSGILAGIAGTALVIL